MFFEFAMAMARKSARQGGLPIGAALVEGDVLLGIGHNQRVQCGSPILHAEMDALNNAGRLSHETYSRCTIYSTLAPCYMCAGAIVRAGIPKVVIGEARTTDGASGWLQTMGVELEILDSQEAFDLLADFRVKHPDIWAEDKGPGPFTPNKEHGLK